MKMNRSAIRLLALIVVAIAVAMLSASRLWPSGETEAGPAAGVRDGRVPEAHHDLFMGLIREVRPNEPYLELPGGGNGLPGRMLAVDHAKAGSTEAEARLQRRSGDIGGPRPLVLYGERTVRGAPLAGIDFLRRATVTLHVDGRSLQFVGVLLDGVTEASESTELLRRAEAAAGPDGLVLVTDHPPGEPPTGAYMVAAFRLKNP